MKKSEKNPPYQVWYRLFYVLLLICVGLFGAGKLLGIAELSVWHVLAAFACGMILVGIDGARGRAKVFCIVSLLGCLLLCFLVADKTLLNEFCLNYLDWAGEKAGWKEEWVTGYGCIQALLLALGCYLFWRIAEHFAVLKKLSAVAVFAALIICLIRKVTVSHLGVAFCLWYVLMIYVEATQEKWKKVREHDDRHYMIWLLPFCILYFLLCCVMPVSEKPYDWAFVKTAYHNVKEAAITHFRNATRNGKEDFGLAVSGFSEDGKLGAGFIEDKRALLEIKGKGGLVTNIYLIGKIYDTFDGQGWEQVAVGDTKDRFLDAMETLYAVERFDGEKTADYVSQTELTLRYDYLDTGYVFTPLKTWQTIDCEPVYDGTNLLFGEQKGYGTEYKTFYHQINVDHPAFYEMLEAEKEPEEETWKALMKRYSPKGESLATIEDLEEHRAYIYEYYGEKPILSERVENYLEEITAGAETDLEKLRAIEAELSSYTYTRTPGKLPEEIQDENSYLEYFLLESKQGYCSYFATAFVLLARAEGIPARYVEGFCVPTNKERKMTVYSNMAHAWPEVYIDEVGWIPFEPTPGYEEVRYTPWKIKGQAEEVLGHAPLMAAEEEEEEKSEIAEVTEKKAVITEGQKQIFRVGIVGIAVIILLICLIDYLLGRYRYRHMEMSEQFLVEFRKNMWVLSQYGLVRDEAETMQEFRKRIRQISSGLPECDYGFLLCYEEILYGDRETTGNDIEIVKEERHILLQQIKEQRKRKYFLMCLRLLRYQ